MNITKCDICKKKVKKGEEVINLHFKRRLGWFEICEKCGEPIFKIMREKKLIKNDER